MEVTNLSSDTKPHFDRWVGDELAGGDGGGGGGGAGGEGREVVFL